MEGSKERKMLNDYCNKPQEKEDSNIEESDINWNDLQSFMINVSQPCHEMLVACYWHGEKYKCEDLFNPTLTDEGICCSFNKVKRDFIFHNPRDLSDLNVTFPFESIDWTPERGYPEGANVDHLPWRAWGAGSHLGLSIVLDANLDEYYCSSEVSIGFKVVLHNSVETPKMNAFATLLEPGIESRMIVDPLIMTSTEQFQRIPVQKRNCVFGSERNLSFYRTYTQRNCALECEAKFTLDACNCVLYYMPKNESTRICSRTDQDCAQRALKAMELRLIDDGNISASLNTSRTKACGCKPGCFAVAYKIKQSTSKLTSKNDIDKELLGEKDTTYFSKNMAVLHVFFTETQYTAHQRGELFGFTELLSNTGGLLGLFMGFSFLSAVEAVYFLTLRLWCSLHRRRDKTSPITPYKIAKAKTPFPFTQ
ncbi:hypothetical protein J6590_032233 [Homalodisca vitripennis]|nr:hypothetical protein J6590_032233 [Homalodisca vitripennis]